MLPTPSSPYQLLPHSARKRQHKARDRFQKRRCVLRVAVAVIEAEREGRGALPAVEADEAGQGEVNAGYSGRMGQGALTCRGDMC